MPKLAYVLVLVATLLAITPSQVLACSGATLSFWDAFTSATEIFSGKVVKIEKASQNTLNVTFQVLQRWRGSTDEHLIVSTASQITACGVPFEGMEADEFLVYAYGSADQLYTNVFSRTVPLSAAGADLLKLNMIANPLLIVLISVAVGFAVMGISRNFLRKRRNRALAENKISEIQSSAVR